MYYAQQADGKFYEGYGDVPQEFSTEGEAAQHGKPITRDVYVVACRALAYYVPDSDKGYWTDRLQEF